MPSVGPHAAYGMSPTPATGTRRLGEQPSGRPRGHRVDLFPYLLMAPGLLLVLFVTLYPIVFAVNYSVMRTQVFKQLAFVGVDNYVRLLTDPRFHTNLLNSLFFVLIGVGLTWTFGLGLALFPRDLAYSGLSFHLAASDGPVVRTISMPPIVPRSLTVKLDEM